MAARILFFVPDWHVLNSPIVDSQVLAVARVLSEHGWQCAILGAESSKSRSRMAISRIESEYGIPAIVLPTLGARDSAVAYFRSAAQLARYQGFDSGDFSYVYSRSFIAAYWARRMARRLGATTVYDVRGLAGEEQAHRTGHGIRARLVTLLERAEIRRAGKLATVSEGLRDHISQSCGRKDISVIPSCYDESRFFVDQPAGAQIRQKYGIKASDVVLCYSGGVAGWQRIDDVVALLSDICLRSPVYRAMIISPESEAIQRSIKNCAIPADRFIVVRALPEEVRSFLSAADLGIVLREDIVLNNVASPVKVAEYLACGLPVVLSKGVGDYSQKLPENGVGLLLDESRDASEQIAAFVSERPIRERKAAAADYARRNLTVASKIDCYRQLYEL